MSDVDVVRPAMAEMRAAAVVSWVLALGFGLPGVYAVWYFATTGEVAIFLGFPTYGSGPFEDVGVPTTVPVLIAFLVVCLVEALVGLLLWRGRMAAIAMALLILPFELIFWWGFALPFGPLLGVARTVLVVVAWLQQRRLAPPPMGSRWDPAP